MIAEDAVYMPPTVAPLEGRKAIRNWRKHTRGSIRRSCHVVQHETIAAWARNELKSVEADPASLVPSYK